MKTKLALCLEKSVIEGLKEPARKPGISQSQFIEREYTSFSKRANSEKPIPDYFKKMQFDGDIPSGLDWKKERDDFLKEKHG